MIKHMSEKMGVDEFTVSRWQKKKKSINEDKKINTANLTVTMRDGGIIVLIIVMMAERVAVEELVHAPPRQRLHQVL